MYSNCGVYIAAREIDSQSFIIVRPGNFLTYVDRAVGAFGNDEAVKQDTRRHMQKIRKSLNRKL